MTSEKTEIKLGKGRGALTLDAGKLISRCALIQGGRDSGKSYLSRVIVEQTIQAGLQTIILDPEGEFATLREKCSVLIAGRDGDVPTEVRSAKLLARRIAETGVSTVVDLSDLKPQQRYEFVRIFLDTFDQLPKSMQRRPRLFVIDEAHLYCPESGKGKAVSAESVVVLMSQGRKRGHGTILVTQRLSKIRKDAANECGTFFIGNTAPSDLATAQEVLGITKKDREALRDLPPGTFWAAGSGVGNVRQFQVRKAITTHPEPGDRYKLQTPPPQKAIAKILREFESLPPSKEEEEAHNAAELKKAYAALKREKTALERRVGGLEKKIEALHRRPVAAVPKELLKVLPDLHKALGAFAAKRAAAFRVDGQALETLVSLVDLANRIAKNASAGPPAPVPSPSPSPPSQPRSSAPARPSRPPSPSPSPPLPTDLPFSWSSCPGRIVTVLVQYRGERLARGRVAALAGVSAKKSTFRNALTDLRQVEGLVGFAPGEMWATEETVAAYADALPALPSGDELIDGWRARLGGAELRIFDALLAAGGAASRDEVCAVAELDPEKSTARNAYTGLRRKGLIESGPGDLSLTDHVLEAMG